MFNSSSPEADSNSAKEDSLEAQFELAVLRGSKFLQLGIDDFCFSKEVRPGSSVHEQESSRNTQLLRYLLQPLGHLDKSESGFRARVDAFRRPDDCHRPAQFHE